MVQPGSLSFTCTTLKEMFCVDPRGLVEDLKDAEGEKKSYLKKIIWVLASHVWHRGVRKISRHQGGQWAKTE